MLPCAHRFHRACVDVWLYRNPACPTCRQPALPAAAHTPLHGHRLDRDQPVVVYEAGGVYRFSAGRGTRPVRPLVSLSVVPVLGGGGDDGNGDVTETGIELGRERERERARAREGDDSGEMEGEG